MAMLGLGLVACTVVGWLTIFGLTSVLGRQPYWVRDSVALRWYGYYLLMGALSWLTFAASAVGTLLSTWEKLCGLLLAAVMMIVGAIPYQRSGRTGISSLWIPGGTWQNHATLMFMIVLMFVFLHRWGLAVAWAVLRGVIAFVYARVHSGRKET